MIRLFKSFSAKIWTLTLLLIILSGLAISFARLLTPLVSDFRADIEQLASEVIGQPVLVGEFTGEWRGLGPELILRNVSLINTKSREVTLNLPEIRISLALIDSLRNWGISPRQISFVRPRLLITRHRDGSFSTAGLEAPTEDSGARSRSGLFLLPSRVKIEQGDIYWKNEAIGGEPLHLSEVNVTFRNAGERHQLGGSLSLPGQTSGRLRVSADVLGRLDQPSAWSGQLYLKGANIDLGQVLRYRLPLDYNIDQGIANAEAWSTWRNGQLTEISGRTHWQKLALSRDTDSDDQPATEFIADNLGGDFVWLRQADGWRLDLNRMQFATPTSTWPENHFALEWRTVPNDLRYIRAGIGFVRIEDLTSLLPMSPIQLPELNDILDGITPQGDMHNLKLILEETDTGYRWQGEADADQLNTRTWKEIPGIENLSGHFTTNDRAGRFDFDSQALNLDLTPLFRDPLFFQKLQGEVRWQQRENGDWLISGDELIAENADIKTRTRLNLTLPADDQVSPFLDLQSDFMEGDGSQASKYYPTGIMGEHLVKWLDNSIIGGDVVSGGCLVRGPLRDFPFEKTASGRFEVLFRVENAVLDYWDGWPRLEGLSSEIRFLNNRFDAWVDSGTLFNSQMQQAHAQIQNLAQASPFELQGEVSGPFADTLRLLRESPLSQNFGPMTEGMQASGNSRLALDLGIPLTQGEIQLDGRLEFKNSGLRLVEWGLPITAINGVLQFDQDRVQASAIQGETLGSAISVDVTTPEDNPAITRILGSGLIASDQLAGLYPDLELPPISGSSDWQLQLDIAHQSAQKADKARLALSSDLQGVAVDLPTPLGKAAEQTRDLSISTRFNGKTEQPLELAYGDLLQALLLLEKPEGQPLRVSHGNIRLGDQPAALPEQPGISLTGGWKNLALEPWLEALKKPGPETGEMPLSQIDLQFGQVNLGKKQLKDFSLTLQKSHNRWGGRSSSDAFSGSLQIPADLKQQPLRVHLDYLHLQSDPEQIAQASSEADSSDLDPESLPAMDLVIDELTINSKPFGTLQLKSSRHARGLTLDRLAIASDGLTINSSGSWLKEPDQTQTTALEIDLHSDDFGTLLEDLGFARNLEEAPTTIKGQLNWSGTPVGFRRDGLNGELTLHLDQGRFLNVDPGVGRIFGLLNLSALQRRLSLDFSDMLQKGFTFDRITGKFHLDSGDAYTSDFEMKGPAALIEISGRTGLASEDFDQLVTVTPLVTSSFPVAGAIAAGPAVGAALFVAQKLFGKQLDKITRIQYLVTGPWDDPVFVSKRQAEEDEEEEDFDPLQLSPDNR